ncbi:hypothetical protein CI610_02530 [invertebrate metagenome]|uniref:Nucleoprotein/polynucleotide-associated enzyme n=1 Tax=invertebrate metagenome TaxID=1711999 RepID=A0A2H9T5P5_9ZZZZ
MKAGLASKQQALKAKTVTRKKKKEAIKSGTLTEQERRQQALEKEREQQAARDRELNRQREAANEEKAITAQVRQLIERNRISREAGDIGYNFAVGKKIKKIYVTEEIQNKLIIGQLAIVVFDEESVLIPRKVAEKIQERRPEVIALMNDKKEEQDSEEDWYADYEIPDDLMW